MKPPHPNVSPSDARLLDELTRLVSQAAGKVMAMDPATIARKTKSDLSPVTAADEIANEVILDGLSRLLPGLPVISEEMAENWACLDPNADFVLVDPLDGTREFLAGRADFTLNVALVRDSQPTLGVIMAPAEATVWRGVVGRGAERLQLHAGVDVGGASEATVIQTRSRPAGGLVATVSRSHFDAQTAAFLTRLPIAGRSACGSSIKFCRVAQGEADIYPRLAPTHEWDIAAGHAILAAAGGKVTRPDGTAFVYGRAGEAFLVPAFIAWGDPLAAEEFAQVL